MLELAIQAIPSVVGYLLFGAAIAGFHVGVTTSAFEEAHSSLAGILWWGVFWPLGVVYLTTALAGRITRAVLGFLG